MILCTGDTHIPHDIKRLNTTNFPLQDNMTKDDYVIICGDFGGVWDDSATEHYWRKWLDERNFTTLFIDGNHENFDLLNAYPVEYWNGGRVHKISDSIIHLMRGQVFEIDGMKIFTFGGAASIDKEFRKEGESWWSEEVPSKSEHLEGLKNLELSGWEVDFIITHTCAESIVDKYMSMKGKWKYDVDYSTEKYLEEIKGRLKYKHWLFGHFHDDFKIDLSHTILYENIINLDKYW